MEERGKKKVVRKKPKRKEKVLVNLVVLTILVFLLLVSNMFWFYQISDIKQETSKKLYEMQLEVNSLNAQIEKVGEYTKIIEELSKLNKGQFTPHQITQMAQVIVTYSEEYKDIGLSPAIVFAVMERESHFNPLAVSEAHAYGLMQVLKSTAYPILIRLGYDASVDNLLDPVINLKVGLEHLISLKKMWLAEKIETPEDWKITFHSYFWGEKLTRELLEKKGRVNVPSLEYGAGVWNLRNKWMKKGLW